MIPDGRTITSRVETLLVVVVVIVAFAP